MRFFMVLSEYCSMLLPVLACFLLVGGIAVIVYLKKISEAFFADIHSIASSLREIARKNDRN